MEVWQISFIITFKSIFSTLSGRLFLPYFTAVGGHLQPTRVFPWLRPYFPTSWLAKLTWACFCSTRPPLRPWWVSCYLHLYFLYFFHFFLINLFFYLISFAFFSNASLRKNVTYDRRTHLRLDYLIFIVGTYLEKLPVLNRFWNGYIIIVQNPLYLFSIYTAFIYIKGQCVGLHNKILFYSVVRNL